MTANNTINFYDVVFVGGGAASFFAAINLAEQRPDLKLVILERSKEVLSKVRISGGGRCNVTHAVFDPRELASHYPRGQQELLGPFNRFMTGDTIAWFEQRSVPLKTEEDGRMFPESDSSESIIACFLNAVNSYGISIAYSQNVQDIQVIEATWTVNTKTDQFFAQAVFCGAGSSPKMWQLLAKMGYDIVPAVPSLFTFNIAHELIRDLQGISSNGTVKVISDSGKSLLEGEGPILITHWGLSGPAILKLSAWGAIVLNQLNYKFTIRVNWAAGISLESAMETFKNERSRNALQKPFSRPQFGLTKRLWQRFITLCKIEPTANWADLSNQKLLQLGELITASELVVDGKSTFKEEFVTAGGVALNQIHFKTFESRLHPGLYFAGEVLNIDAVTGGFNFQNAWTGGYLAALNMANTL